MNLPLVTTETEDQLIRELQTERQNLETPEVFADAMIHAWLSGQSEARDRSEKNALAILRSLPPARIRKITDAIAADNPAT